MQHAMKMVIAMLLLGASAAALAEVTRIEITRKITFASGQAFGNVGAYERLAGKFYGELDPKHHANAGIVDIDKAPLNTRGRVEYSADLEILKPADIAKGNGALLYDVNDRGNMRLLIPNGHADECVISQYLLTLESVPTV